MMDFLNQMDEDLDRIYGTEKKPKKIDKDEEAEYIHGIWGKDKHGDSIYKYLNRETQEWVDEPPEGATYTEFWTVGLDKERKLFQDKLDRWKESGEIPEWINTEDDLQKHYSEEFQKQTGIYGIEPQYFTEDGEFIPESKRYGDVPNPYLEEGNAEYSMGGKVQEHGNSAIDKLINGDE